MMQEAAYKAELDALTEQLHVSGYRPHTLPSLQEWREVFHDVTPAQLVQRLTKAVPGHKGASIDIQLGPCNSSAWLVLRHDGGFHDYKNYMQFLLWPGDYADVDKVFLSDDMQGRDTIKHYLRSAASLFKDIGLNRMVIQAQEVGAYAWAKYGFTPCVSDNWGEMYVALKARLNDPPPTLTFQGRTYPIPTEMPAIRKVLQTPFSDLEQNFHHLAELNRPIGEYKGHTLTVGKALLIDTGWFGDLPLADHEPAYQRFKTYTDPACEQHRSRP